MNSNQANPFAEGGQFEMADVDFRGTVMTVFKNAPANLAELYRAALVDHADTDFYVYEDERYTFADGWQQACQVAASLIFLGVKPGDRVGISMRNYPEWVWCFMGITSIGAVTVAMNALWSSEEMEYGVDDSGLKIIFVDRERLEHLGPYLDEKNLTVIAVRTEHSGGKEVMSWTEFGELAEAADPGVEVEPDANATILYTSGSTAHPKGVLSTHRAIIHSLLGWEASKALAVANRPAAKKPRTSPAYAPAMILTVPLFHVTGLNVQLLASFRRGRKLVGMYKWDVDKALSIIERERVTHFSGVPTMAYEIVNSPNYDQYDLSSLRTMAGGGAAMAPEHSKQISKRSGGNVSPGAGYGMTETNGLGTSIGGRDLAQRPKSCGRALKPLVDIKIVDPRGQTVPCQETGEIWIRGAMNFSGYWNQPEATSIALTDGWVHTGDVGYLDDEGFVFITDREKDLVIRGGENIGCQEVEAVILEHPHVAECAVFGVPDERLGETVAAVVMPALGQSLTATDVKSHVAEHIARFKVPQHVWLQTEQLPRIASGKIFKRGLREAAIEKLLSAR